MQKNSLMRIVSMALLLYALFSFLSVRSDLRRTEALAEAFQGEVEQLQKENVQLQDRLSSGWSDEELRRLAWERLALVMPGEKLFYFIEAEN